MNLLRKLHSALTGRRTRRTEKDDARIISEHFDRDFYLSCNKDVRESGADPLIHFCRFGWRELRDPSPDFSTQYYILKNKDVQESGQNPFAHYIAFGRSEGRTGKLPSHSSNTSVFFDIPIEKQINDVTAHFDEEFYRSSYEDVIGAEVDPLNHYMLDGWREGRDPSAEFSTLFYLSANPDVAASGINPLWHYVVAGRNEGRMSRRSSPAETQASEEEVEIIRRHFDVDFYRDHNHDLDANIDAVAHYCHYGWREGRDPCHEFSTRFYLEANPDVLHSGVNPFWHYLVAGRAERRMARHPGGDRVERLRHTIPLEEEVRNWRSSNNPKHLLSARQLRDQLISSSQQTKKTLIMSVGHDNYRNVSGGVQLCESREEALSADAGCVYLHLHPWQALPRLSHEIEDNDPIVSLLLDGKPLGECRISELIGAAGLLHSAYINIEIVIHHLLGHLPERLADLVHATGSNSCWLWIHDYFTICPSYTLQRNGVSYCGAPPVTSNECHMCRFGEERLDHASRMQIFFDRVKVHLIAPSRAAADL